MTALTAAVAALNIILGLVYTSYGTMTADRDDPRPADDGLLALRRRPGSRWRSPAARTTGSTASTRVRGPRPPASLDLSPCSSASRPG